MSIKQAKVLPVWHGAKQKKIPLICLNGFKSDGKHHYDPKGGASPGADPTTDIGYFGSGMYFTNSAGYASRYGGDGCLVLAWVSMREPYPVISNNPNPEKRDEIEDIRKLQRLGHY